MTFKSRCVFLFCRVQVNKSITSLDLRSNKLDAEAGKALGAALEVRFHFNVSALFHNIETYVGEYNPYQPWFGLQSPLWSLDRQAGCHERQIRPQRHSGSGRISEGIQFHRQQKQYDTLCYVHFHDAQVNKTLTILNLRSNSLRTEGGIAIGKSLEVIWIRCQPNWFSCYSHDH